MTRNSETTTSGKSYIEEYGPDDGDRDVGPRRHSLRLNMVAGVSVPLRGTTTTIVAAALATAVAHSAPPGHDEEVAKKQQAQGATLCEAQGLLAPTVAQEAPNPIPAEVKVEA